MNQMPRGERPVLRRDEVAAWMRGAIALAQSLPRNALTSRAIAPAGIAVQIHVDDPALAKGYFSRLCGAAADARLADQIYVLSGKLPLPGLGPGPVPGWNDFDCPPARFQVILEAAELRAAYPLIPRFWQFYDRRSRIGIQLTQSRDDLPKWDSAAPLRRHLHWLLEDRGLRLSHAATLGWRDRGLILLGRGGAGKSGTTLAGLAAGLSTVGDDYVALGTGEAPFARSLFRILKQDREGLARIPGLGKRTARLAANWQGKVEFDPDEIFPGAMVEELALRAVVIPEIAHAATPAILPASRADAMLALMASNLQQHLGERETGLPFFAGLLRRMPCYRLLLSDDAGANGAILRSFLEGLPPLPRRDVDHCIGAAS